MIFLFQSFLFFFQKITTKSPPLNQTQAKEHYYLSLLFFIRTLQLVLRVLPKSNLATKNTNSTTKNSNLDHNNTNKRKKKRNRDQTQTQTQITNRDQTQTKPRSQPKPKSSADPTTDPCSQHPHASLRIFPIGFLNGRVIIVDSKVLDENKPDPADVLNSIVFEVELLLFVDVVVVVVVVLSKSFDGVEKVRPRN